MAPPARYDAERLFRRRDGRLYRPRLSRAEAYASVVILVVLGAIVLWVSRRGRRVDADLFTAQPLVQRSSAAGQGPGAAPRGALPAQLALPGWREGAVSHFGADELYLKINGRADFFRSFGAQRLSFVALSDGARSVDVELYDHGSAPNAFGAYSAERSAAAQVTTTKGGLGHRLRNALYWVRGRFYLRAIGSDESAATVAQLDRVRDRLDQAVSGAALPWAYALLVDTLGYPAASVSYVAQDAFSFDFARAVYAARRADEGQTFVVACADDAAARALAQRFIDGFASYGTLRQKAPPLVEDRYQHSWSGALAVGRLVVGVRATPTRQSAQRELGRLSQAVRNPALVAAVPPVSPAVAPERAQEGYDG